MQWNMIFSTMFESLLVATRSQLSNVARKHFVVITWNANSQSRIARADPSSYGLRVETIWNNYLNGADKVKHKGVHAYLQTRKNKGKLQ